MNISVLGAFGQFVKAPYSLHVIRCRQGFYFSLLYIFSLFSGARGWDGGPYFQYHILASLGIIEFYCLILWLLLVFSDLNLTTQRSLNKLFLKVRLTKFRKSYIWHYFTIQLVRPKIYMLKPNHWKIMNLRHKKK